MLEQNIKGEQCAIGVYNRLLDITRDKDPVTYNMVLTILQQEVEHEEDLQALLEDIHDNDEEPVRFSVFTSSKNLRAPRLRASPRHGGAMRCLQICLVI